MKLYNNLLSFQDGVMIPIWTMEAGDPTAEKIGINEEIIQLSDNYSYAFNGRINVSHFVNRYTEDLWYEVFLQRLDYINDAPIWSEVEGTRSTIRDNRTTVSFLPYSILLGKDYNAILPRKSSYRIVITTNFSRLVQPPFTNQKSLAPTKQNDLDTVYYPLELTVINLGV